MINEDIGYYAVYEEQSDSNGRGGHREAILQRGKGNIFGTKNQLPPGNWLLYKQDLTYEEAVITCCQVADICYVVYSIDSFINPENGNLKDDDDIAYEITGIAHEIDVKHRLEKQFAVKPVTSLPPTLEKIDRLTERSIRLFLIKSLVKRYPNGRIDNGPHLCRFLDSAVLDLRTCGLPK